MIDLTEKSIVVTGGASGIGAAICDSANREGAHVGIIDVNEEAAQVLAKEQKPGTRAAKKRRR